MVQEVNRQFVERVEGFEVIGVASSGTEGLELVSRLEPDLAILDIFMPGLDGVETLQRMRSQLLSVDVIVISAANDMATIERMLQNGATDYIMKPFKFERVKQALEHYRHKKETLVSARAVTQSELDRLLFGQRLGAAASAVGADLVKPDTSGPAAWELPKGLQVVTMRQIIQFLKGQSEPLSAEEVAEGVGIARVTARRYLEYLEKTGDLRRDLQYGVGRPLNKYVWTDKTSS